MEIALAGKYFQVDFAVVALLRTQSILGLDFMEGNQCVVNAGQKTLHLRGLGVPIQTATRMSCLTESSVALLESIRIPALGEVEVMAESNEVLGEGMWLLERICERDLPVLVAGAVVTPVTAGPSTCVPVRLVNPSFVEAVAHKRSKIAVVEQLDVAAVMSVRDEPQSMLKTPSVNKEKQEMLWRVMENSAEKLTESKRNQLYVLLTAYADVFSCSDDELGRAGQLKHSINTGNHQPISQPACRVPPYRRKEVQKLLQDMQKRDVIQLSTSPWASPVVLVQKKNGTLRFCIDYRKLNAITRKDAYPIPRIDDTLDTLAGSTWFTTLDLVSGYWQVEMSDKDRAKMAFCAQEGLFEFTVMPFGLCNAPATFQHIMDLVLARDKWSTCLMYLDDIVIVGRTFEQHLGNVKDLLEKLRQAGLRLKPGKCAFFQNELNYLGHIVSEGVATDNMKTEKVAAWPEPKTLTELQGFLGLANYYMQFIRNFAAMAKLLHQLTE